MTPESTTPSPSEATAGPADATPAPQTPSESAPQTPSESASESASTPSSTRSSTPAARRRDRWAGSRAAAARRVLRRVLGGTATGVRATRSGLASLGWTLALVAAGILLLGVVLVVAGANTHNALVAWVLRTADVLDLGVFGRDTGVKRFAGAGAATKNAVVNWGLGAVAWLAAGRVARRVLLAGRP